MAFGSLTKFFQDEKSKEMIKNICVPIGTAISEQFYVYIVIFCVYNVLLFLFVLVIMMMLLKIMASIKQLGIKKELYLL